MTKGEVVVRAGEWKARRAMAQVRREAAEAAAPRRAAISTLIRAHEERKAREDALSSMLRGRDAVTAKIAATEAQLVQLRAETLPEAERAVEAAQRRLNAHTSDLEHARRVMEAEAVLVATEPTQ